MKWLFDEIKSRKLIQTLLIYCGGGFGLMQGVDILANRFHFPEVYFDIFLVFLIAGIPGSLLIAWFHGKGGAQKIQKVEILIQLMLVAVALLFSFRAYRSMDTFSSSPAIEKSIAVLPFTNFSDNKEDEYFSDGVTEDIITQLSKISELKVVSRTSIEQYKGTTKTVRQIGKELSVNSILEGSVRRSGNQVRIVAQLINAVNDKHVWAETYDKEFSQIFAIQSDVALRIAVALQAELSPTEKVLVERKPTENLEAYQMYLMGNYFTSQATGEALQKGKEYFERAIKLDPNYMQPYMGLAYYYAVTTDWFIAPHDAMPKQKELIRKVLSTDPNLAEGHEWLGFYYWWYDWNWDKAEQEFKRSIELNPRISQVYLFYGWYLASMGRFEESIKLAKKGIELEPISIENNAIYGLTLCQARQYDHAVEKLQKAIELDPNYPLAHQFLGWTYIQRGEFSKAVASLEKANQLDDNPFIAGALGYGYAMAGRKKEALNVIQNLKNQSSKRFVCPDFIAEIYSGLKDNDNAMLWLEKAYQERGGWMTSLKELPVWDNLREDPRFHALLKKMNFEKQ